MELLRAVFSPHCSSPCTWMTAHLKTPLSSSWNLQIIQDADESAYRQEVKELAVWCSLNNLELKTLKTVEMILYFRRNPPALPPLTIMNSTVTAVESFRFLGTTYLFFHFKFAHVRPHTWLSVLYIQFLAFCTLPIRIFVYCSFFVCVLSLSFCCSLELLSL